ncbi:MAG: GTPase HflX [Syntrophomonadaceae bacterium]|nr:GTPase HflX [Syntrophomonadaceae bacterium]
MLVGLENPNEPDAFLSLHELGRLVETAGAEVIGQLIQKREQPDRGYYLGRGKVRELQEKINDLEANLVICNDELTPTQLRNLENFLACRILDRTSVILDIFAQQARTREGKLQVELAQLRYLLPRLTGKGVALSRLGGGIGTRGPGETKLETDRRHIRRRIRYLEKEMETVRQRRRLRRERQELIGLPVVALVGYTNAGKSTLLNCLTQAGALAEDRLFSTLDTLSRIVKLPDGRSVLISDTVGFIQKLPHHLVAAFRATLEEVQESELILHVLDLSNPEVEKQKEAVEQVLKEIGADANPILLVYNKIDQINEEQRAWLTLGETRPNVMISAREGIGITALLEAITRHLPRPGTEMELLIPITETRLLSLLHENGQVFKEDYQEDHVTVTAWVEPQIWKQLEPYVIKGTLIPESR